MGLMARLWGLTGYDPPQKRSDEPNIDSLLWAGSIHSAQSVTGISINQYTALNASAVMACVAMLAEDVAKLPWSIFRQAQGEERKEVKDHFLYDLIQEPNDWMNGLEFREMMQLGLIMRGNAYAVIIRNGRGVPIRLVPVNPDWVQLWEAPGGQLFYRVTPNGLHLRAMLQGLPDMIAFDDMLHIRGFSAHGLLGASRITLAREAIALSLGQEQQAARWIGNGAKPSGVLQTDQKMTRDGVDRIAADWRALHQGLQNSGKTVILEQGLKWQQLQMTSNDLEFIASRKFQLEEIARIFRIPMHMIGELSRCMPADTLIFTERGPVRIVDIKIGDRVWSMGESGFGLSRVINNWENGTDDILEIVTTNRTVRCNRRHCILVRRSVERPLRNGEIGGRNVSGKKRRISWREEYVPAGELKPGDTIVTLRNLPDCGHRAAPNGRALTPGFMAFCGLLIGDGNVTVVKGRPVGVQIARSNTAQYMDAYRAIAREEFRQGGYSRHWGSAHHLAVLSEAQLSVIRSTEYVRGNDRRMAQEFGVSRSTVSLARKGATWAGPVVVPTSPIWLVESDRQTMFKSVLAASELAELGFAGTSKTKRVPDWVFGLAENLRLAFLRGFLDADGTVNAKGRIAFDSVNRPMLDDMRHLCMGLGIPVTNVQEIHQVSRPPGSRRLTYTHMHRFTCSDPGQNKRIGSHDPRYMQKLAMAKPFGRKDRHYPRHGGAGFSLPGASLAMIREIRRLPAEPVYDLEVERTHNFVADGVIVHNSTNNNIAQQAQEYINYTLTGYTNRWRAKFSQAFGLRRQGLSIEFDYRELTSADITTRANNWRTMIMSMMAKPDEARIDLGLPPEGGEAAKLHFPQNMAAAGSQSTGTAPDDAGRPPSS